MPIPAGTTGTPSRRASRARRGRARGRTSRPGHGYIGYVPGLDGVRAFAVLAVIAYHGGIGWAPGGFLGVDTFFVLSGYLITSILVGEWVDQGAISLRAFWARRARRLLPALFLMLLAVAAYGALLAPADTLGTLRSDALATLGYAANWHQVVAGQGYFAHVAQPSPLLHTWSLAIEEQFYLLWPLVVLGVVKWRRSPRVLLAISVAGAALSALEMALVFHPGTDISRVYYGTDTRAQTILIGAALALVLRSRRPARKLEAQWGLSLLATVGVAVWAWSLLNATGDAPWLFRGGMALVALAVAAVIACVVQHPRSVCARVLALGPLRYVGRISYGLYLWHWPVFLALNHSRTGLLGWQLFTARCAVTFSVSVLSYHLVELPIRRGALRSWRSWLATPVAAAATAGAVVLATVTALPAVTEASALVANRANSHVADIAPATADPGADLSPLGPVMPAVSQVEVPDPPLRAIIVGDSMAFDLQSVMTPDQTLGYGVRVEPDGIIACGLATGSEVRYRGQVEQPPDGVFVDGYRPCTAVPNTWRDLLAKHVDVVMMFYGPWEVRDWQINGRWMHVGTPEFDALETQRISQAVSLLGSTGAEVVILTSPYFQQPEAPDGSSWPDDDPRRVDAYNSLLYSVAATHPRVAVVPVGEKLSPAGRYQPVIDGLTVRESDGLHLTAAGSAWLARWLLPMVVQLAEQARS